MGPRRTEERRLPYASGTIVPGSTYQIVGVLGVGGMAVVYEAEDTTCGRRVVLKAILPEVAARRSFTAKEMEQEARLLVELQQDTEHVAEVITAGITNDPLGLPYYVMERLNGHTLRQAFEMKRAEARPLTVGEVAGISIDLGAALDHAHRHRIVHQDLKPENAFVHKRRDGTYVIKLLDFGISALIGTSSSGQGFQGTYRYASPEQLRGEPISPATDIYALGLLMFEALTLRPPFEDPAFPLSAQTLAYAHCEIEAPRASAFRRDVPPKLDNLVATCLEKRPENRPQLAHGVVNLLREIRADFEGDLAGSRSHLDAFADSEPPASLTRLEVISPHSALQPLIFPAVGQGGPARRGGPPPEEVAAAREGASEVYVASDALDDAPTEVDEPGPRK